jgi:hypothetical protein
VERTGTNRLEWLIAIGDDLVLVDALEVIVQRCLGGSGVADQQLYARSLRSVE